ncbi:MAG: chromosome segregation protein SMC [Elusimicrobiota bacterium]
MQLKSVELYGFKSFADKTSLEFGDGITAIVGPNGCGKTNIVDAMKWVLGEQSSKSLRGTKMEDVIFNGTTARKATSVSEITLNFDNSKNVLPIDYSEISVTRRLFRTGESEYLLNKTPVRLRDIKDLFLDTGIGTESYSIMEQNKIDFILQSKPEERRFLFEEVAGVSKYKAKREEALKKLEKVGQDLLRLNDILTELESQKSKLDSQARKARQYQKYLAELKNYEINSLVKKYLEIKETNLTKQKELEIINEKQSQLSIEIDKLEAKYSELKLALTSKEDELISKRTEASKIDSAIQILKERIQTAETGKSDLLNRNIEAETEIQQGQDALNSYSTEDKNTKRKLEESEKIIPTLAETVAQKTAEKNKLETEITQITNEIETVRQEIFNTAKELAESHNKNISDETFLKDVNQRITKLENQRKETISQKSDKEKLVNELIKKLTLLNSKIDEKRKIVETETLKLNKIRIEIEKKQTELLTKKELLAQLNAQLEILISNSNHALYSKIKELFKDKILGTVSEIVSVSAENIHIIQSALGEKSNYIIVDTVETAEEIINWLRKENLGWATFLILSEISKMQFTQQSVFSGKKISDLVHCDEKFKKVVEFLLDNAILKNGSIYNRGLIQGGGNRKKSGKDIKKTLGTFSEIGHFQKEIKDLNSEIEKMEALIKNYQNEIATTETNLKKDSDKIETNRNELMPLKTELISAEESLKTAESFIAVLLAEYEELEKQRKKIESTIIANSHQITSQKEKETALNNKLTAMLDKLRQQQQNLDKINHNITDSTIDFSVKSKEVEHLKEKIKNILPNITSISVKIEKAKKRITESTIKIDEYEKIIKNSADEINKIIVSKDEIDDILKTIEYQRNEIKNTMLDVDSNLRNLKSQLQKTNDEIRTLERAVSGTSSEIKQIANRLKEEKQVSIEDAMNNYQETTISDEDISKLKNKIETLGAVNLAAPEEYEQLEQRYNFLIKQKQDLEKAREDLYNAINKINMTTRQNFQKTFVTVRENFRKIFTQLFEGGEADLLFTDESNLLESGIDIIAQPPGKKLQHISLLSGGERALTAIAILFAIYLIKPAPFCVLDEIDGQLDEANILRFTRLLKEFAQTSQFLVITHNKRTMEVANVLYGITMEELGISKIISVRMELEKVPATA